MKPTTRRSIIAGSVLAVFGGSASYAQELPGKRVGWASNGKWTPTESNPGGASFTSTPTPTLPPGEWTATPTNTASATSTLTRTPAPTKTPLPPTATASGFDYAALPGERTQLLDLINGSRAAVRVAPLTWHARLAELAQWRAEDMQARHYSSHLIPAGACFEGHCFSQPVYFWDVASAIGLHWSAAGENLWQGGDYRDQLAEVSNQVFAGSPSHYALMTDPAMTHAGTGMYRYTWTNGTHTVEVFLRPAAPSPGTASVTVSGGSGVSAARATWHPFPTPTPTAAAPCEGDPAAIPFFPPPDASPIVQENARAERELFALINTYRAVPYVWDDALSRAAVWMAADLAQRDDVRYRSWTTRQQFDQHRDSLGRTLEERLRACGYAGGPVGENLDGEVHGSANGDLSVLSEWLYAPEEVALVTSAAYRRIGLARHYSPLAPSLTVWHWVMVVSG
jgi:uncharacterized protein YkwD